LNLLLFLLLLADPNLGRLGLGLQLYMRCRCTNSEPPLGRRIRPYAAEIAINVITPD
jgi:hypothetical protein